MGKDQVIEVPITEVSSETPNPSIEVTDYPFGIFLDTVPT
mgnify:CR=1 FL=1